MRARRHAGVAAARELADHTGRPVRALFSREDVVRLGPKRPPIAATAVFDNGRVMIDGIVAGALDAYETPIEWPYRIEEVGTWRAEAVAGPMMAAAIRRANEKDLARLRQIVQSQPIPPDG